MSSLEAESGRESRSSGDEGEGERVGRGYGGEDGGGGEDIFGGLW